MDYDRVVEEWETHNKDIVTKDINKADVIWISSSWTWNKIPKKHLKQKKVVASIYHIDFKEFDKRKSRDFYKLDKFVHEYHVISQNTKKQLQQLTDKKITSIPFWVNQNIWFHINNKSGLE